MERPEIHKFLHDLNNQLNAATLNAYLLRQLHPNVLDEETIARVEGALRAADRLTKDFRTRLEAEPTRPTAPG